MTDAKKKIEVLIIKAGEAEKSEDAMRFSQAAVNSANALIVLQNIEHNEKTS